MNPLSPHAAYKLLEFVDKNETLALTLIDLGVGQGALGSIVRLPSYTQCDLYGQLNVFMLVTLWSDTYILQDAVDCKSTYRSCKI